MHEQSIEQCSSSVGYDNQLRCEQFEEELSSPNRFEFTHLSLQFQKQQYQQQANPKSLGQSPKLTELSNAKKYPGNCLFKVITYFKLRSQSENSRSEQPGVSKYIWQDGFGTLVSKNVIVSCAHNLINKNAKDYESQPYRIEVLSANEKREVTQYRMIDQYKTNVLDVSSQNDVALLYLKKEVQRDKYICIGVVEDVVGELISIPKLQGKKIEYYNEEKPVINQKRSTNVKYHIPTKPGDSGSPIIMVKDSNFSVYYLIGLHRAKVTLKQSHNEGIVFNNKIIQRIFKLESELIEDQSLRQLSKNCLRINQRQGLLHQQFHLFSVLFRPLQSYQYANMDQDRILSQLLGLTKISKSEKTGIIQEHPQWIQVHNLLNPEFKEFTLGIRRIKEQVQSNKLRQLNKFLQRKFEKPATTYIDKIIYEIYQKIQSIVKCNSEGDIKFHLRQLNQIVDELQFDQVIDMECRNRKQLQDEALKYRIPIESVVIANSLRSSKYYTCLRQTLKLLFFNFALPWKESSWFGIRTKFKFNQQFQFQMTQYLTSLGINQNKPVQFFTHIFSQIQVLYNKKEEEVEALQLQMELKRQAPYRSLLVQLNDNYNYHRILVKYDVQTVSVLQQVKRILQFYHCAGSAILNILKSIAGYMPNYQKQYIGSALKMDMQVKDYYCKSFQKINYDSTLKAIDSVQKLKTLIANITNQLLVLHNGEFSLCCPLEFAMIVNLATLEVGFFYIGHPQLLVSFIQRKFEDLEQLAEYYPIGQIVELAKGEARMFRKIDVWMYAQSLLRFLNRIQVIEITNSSYFANLRLLLQRLLRPLCSRMKLPSVKRQLQRLAEQDW